MLRGRLFASIVAAVLTVNVGHAVAATITVNTVFDDTSPGDGQCSLRKAVGDVAAPGSNNGDCAPAAFGDNTIVLADGTYSLSEAAAGSMSALRIPSTVTNLTIVGNGERSTTIDASGSGARVMEIAAGAKVTLSDLTITGGRAPDGVMGTANFADSPGGDGQAGANGGAILNQGTLAVDDSAVTNSTAGSGGSGGVGGSSTSAGGATGGAGGPGGDGGGIYNTGNLELNGATISGNQSGTGGDGGGGGIGGQGNGGAGGGGGAGGDGGGISNSAGALTVVDSTINGDSTGNGGNGGLGGQGSAVAGAGGLGGSAAGGGGVFSVQGVLSVTNGTFASDAGGSGGAGGAGGPGGTTAGGGGAGGGGGGGGGLNVVNPGSAVVQSVTMAGNNAGAGGTGGTGAGDGNPGSGGAVGGILDQGGATTLQNTLLFLNNGGNCSSSLLDDGHNLSFGAGGCPPTFISGNPNLGPLQDNGGPTKTISLQSGSAAIDRIPAGGAGCPATDQRGVPRPGGLQCDIGAYEVASPKATTDPPADVSARGATLAATVTPNSGAAGVSFEYGKNTRYGSQTTVQTLDGVTAMPVTAKIGKLAANTTYHYRVRITSADGAAMGRDETLTTSSKPTLHSLRLKPSRFKAAGVKGNASTSGSTISYTDTQAAKTRFVVLAGKPGVKHGGKCVAPPKHGTGGHRRCTRYVKRVGGFTHADVAGRNKLHFSGRLGGRKLAPATYELQATPKARGKTGTTASTKFTVIR